MKYQCNKCGTEFTPGMFDSQCPKCSSSDLKVIYSYAKAKAIAAKK